ncbi:hypothetical protein CTI14_59510, partial [Methylobacterium radiotolerans]
PADYRQRFRVINLITLKQDPTGGNQALALEHGDDLAQHVAEYAIGTHDFGTFMTGIPAMPRLEAMQAQLPADYRQRFRVINLITLKQDPTGGNQALALEHG